MAQYPVKYAVDFEATGVVSGPTPAVQGVGNAIKLFYNYSGDVVTDGVLTIQGRRHAEDSWEDISVINTDGFPHEVEVFRVTDIRISVTTTQTNTKGTLFGVLKDSGVINTPPFDDDSARGAIPNWSSDHKFGRNPLISTSTTPEDIWNGGGIYLGIPVGSAGETVDVASSDAADTATGTGARVIELFGLDANYNEQSELITLAGLTKVTSTKIWVRVNRYIIISSGSVLTNAGVITINHTTTTDNIFIVSPIGSGGSKVLITTVPAGMVLLLKGVYVVVEKTSGGGTDVELTLRSCNAVTGEQRILRHWAAGELIPLNPPFSVPLLIEEKTDLWVRVDSVSANNTVVSGDMQFTLAPMA